MTIGIAESDYVGRRGKRWDFDSNVDCCLTDRGKVLIVGNGIDGLSCAI